jgi:16S rRNA (adenine1518-N6/adenine1519-N6)-dimethyltransferase
MRASACGSDRAVRWTRHALVEILRERGLRPKKSLGQNFLVDPNFLAALARDTGATKDDGVIEIGSGPGNLTDALAAVAGHVWAFEVDERLHALSRELLAGRANVTLLCGDGAEFESRVDAGAWRRLRVVSNLPYFDWQRLLLRLLSTRLPVATFTIMVQGDLYARLRAKPGSREYGPMPALLQAACEIRRIRTAGRALFLPVPGVDSTVFELVRREVLDFTAAESALRALFAHRRKKSAAVGGRRVEQLSPAELLSLARRG